MTNTQAWTIIVELAVLVALAAARGKIRKAAADLEAARFITIGGFVRVEPPRITARLGSGDDEITAWDASSTPTRRAPVRVPVGRPHRLRDVGLGEHPQFLGVGVEMGDRDAAALREAWRITGEGTESTTGQPTGRPEVHAVTQGEPPLIRPFERTTATDKEGTDG